MLDSLTPFWRHAVIVGITVVLTVFGILIDPTNATGWHLPTAWIPPIAMVITLFGTYFTRLVDSYGYSGQKDVKQGKDIVATVEPIVVATEKAVKDSAK